MKPQDPNRPTRPEACKDQARFVVKCGDGAGLFRIMGLGFS